MDQTTLNTVLGKAWPSLEALPYPRQLSSTQTAVPLLDSTVVEPLKSTITEAATHPAATAEAAAILTVPAEGAALLAGPTAVPAALAATARAAPGTAGEHAAAHADIVDMALLLLPLDLQR
ncbi:hypothetical protein ONE63_010374 [Megalurothrips usitatus]|uniref:Uncharacterized protein n=1 Tax=Megalurothrips usitatus TaxID=439358 RepID=A0AAV7XHL8_9NEOP|nr:hypothetical protein ONE63_010374 [Megalurothrips usitatus]